MKVLVIEDNEDNLYLVEYLLSRKGHEIREARNGTDGIHDIANSVPDIILLDIQLPDMSGYEVAKLLRQNAVLDTVPIIAVTSFAMSGDRVLALSAGCDAYIEKPINPETFDDEIVTVAKVGRVIYGGGK